MVLKETVKDAQVALEESNVMDKYKEGMRPTLKDIELYVLPTLESLARKLRHDQLFDIAKVHKRPAK